MGILSTLVKTGLLAGATITAYQAASVSKKKKSGKIDLVDFTRNFKDLAVKNINTLVDSFKGKSDGKAGEYRCSDKGENGYSYPDSSESSDVVSEVFETMKEKAPEVIGKVQNLVEDLRDNAPEYKAKAQDFVEDIKTAAKKALDIDDKKAQDFVEDVKAAAKKATKKNSKKAAKKAEDKDEKVQDVAEEAKEAQDVVEEVKQAEAPEKDDK